MSGEQPPLWDQYSKALAEDQTTSIALKMASDLEELAERDERFVDGLRSALGFHLTIGMNLEDLVEAAIKRLKEVTA